MSPSHSDLHSSRWVTSGYRNVFHRAFLYGMGLTERDMNQPFAGLAVAHNEATPGQSLVKALCDLAKRSLATVGFTERQFAVPETSATPLNSVSFRELAADSAELAVRGHWYDALVGVSASVPSAFGLAQAILRLGIPGVVLIPAERVAVDATLAVAARVLEEVGLGTVVSVDSGTALDDRLTSMYTRVHAQIGTTEDMARRRADFNRSLPETATSGAVFAHVCALGHELGMVRASELVNDDISSVTLELGDRRIATLAGIPRSVVSLVVEDSNSAYPVLRDESGRRYVVVPENGSSQVTDTADVALLVVPTPADVEVITGSVQISVRRANAARDPMFTLAAVAGCTHPGYVDSDFNYDRL